MGEYSLVDLVKKATHAEDKHIMLLRHSPAATNELARCGASDRRQLVEEYTCVQRVGEKYDFWKKGKPRIEYVVVIVEDKVFAVYHVLDVGQTSTYYELSSEPFRSYFNSLRTKAERQKERQKEYQEWLLDWGKAPARRFRVEQIPCEAVGKEVKGWEGSERTAVVRCKGARFKTINVTLPEQPLIGGGSRREVTKPQTRADSLSEDLAAIMSQKIAPTTRQTLVDARIGQGTFRSKVLQLWGGCCCVTCSETVEAIRASHIKPWRESTDEERLDPYNGLPLVATLDALFDAGLISFESSGKLILSSRLSAVEKQIFGIDEGLALATHPTQKTGEYLAYHRKHRFRR